MSGIKIDKNVPFPQHLLRQMKYPFDQMEVGDSFFAPMQDPRNISGSVAAAKKKHPKRGFTTEGRFEGNFFGVRVWRTE